MTGILTPEKAFSLPRQQLHAVAFKDLPLLSKATDIEEKLRTFKKFMFVRRPVERVLSAYIDKLVKGNESGFDFMKYAGRTIEKKYRKKITAGGTNVTFSEFIRFISELEPTTKQQKNEHWLPMHELCDPCSVEYDFIGKMENQEEDANFVLEWIGMKEQLGKFPPLKNTVHTKHQLSVYLKQLSYKELVAFYAKYLPDYLLSDYEIL